MKLKRKEWRKLSCGLVMGAVLAVLAATWGFVQADIWLASTQWLLVAVVLGILGVYARLEG
jgi:hypothetical protein